MPSSDPPAASEADHNGKDKYQRQVRHGKLMVICATAVLLSVFLILRLKVIPQKANPILRLKVIPQKANPQQATTTKKQTLQIPPCPTSPWKENENLQGKCPGDLKSYPDATTISQCASTCCSNEECISWQYRQDVGCLQGKDIRLGQEKDGPAAWCSDHPPQRWQGQYLKPHKKKGAVPPKEKLTEEDIRKGACDEKTWNPNEEIGQCFGLGDVKRDASGSAKDCMKACCENEKCGAWQWNKELGCFYAGGMHGCQGEGDPVAFEPFAGRRKRLESRRYTDKHNKPWQMTYKS